MNNCKLANFVCVSTFFITTPLCYPDNCHLGYASHTSYQIHLVYRVATREGLLVADLLRTSWCCNDVAL